eukprot:5851804-Pyramimonas_sp.AAC.1
MLSILIFGNKILRTEAHIAIAAPIAATPLIVSAANVLRHTLRFVADLQSTKAALPSASWMILFTAANRRNPAWLFSLEPLRSLRS